MSLSDSLNAKKFDVRLIKQNIKRGAVTEEEVQKHESSLPDDSSKAEKVRFIETSTAPDPDEVH